MKISIHGVPEFQFPMNKQLVELLMQCSKLHYDSKCKQASEPVKGGFINGWNNTVLYSEEKEPLVNATWNDLDTTLKILEMIPYYPPTAEEKDILYKFSGNIKSALLSARQVRIQWRFDHEC